MEQEQRLRIINEIRQMERELHLKKSALASAEAMEHDTAPAGLLNHGSDVNERKKIFSELIADIALCSGGGDSVEDLKKEREK
ncbi:MAG: hypothetical protein ABIH23_09145 [bacterium]